MSFILMAKKLLASFLKANITLVALEYLDIYGIWQIIYPGDTCEASLPGDLQPRFDSEGFQVYVNLEAIAKTFQDNLRSCKGPTIAFMVHLVPISIWERIIASIPFERF